MTWQRTARADACFESRILRDDSEITSALPSPLWKEGSTGGHDSTAVVFESSFAVSLQSCGPEAHLLLAGRRSNHVEQSPRGSHGIVTSVNVQDLTCDSIGMIR